MHSTWSGSPAPLLRPSMFFCYTKLLNWQTANLLGVCSYPMLISESVFICHIPLYLNRNLVIHTHTHTYTYIRFNTMLQEGTILLKNALGKALGSRGFKYQAFIFLKKYFLNFRRKNNLKWKNYSLYFCWIITNSRKQWNAHYCLTKYKLILCTEWKHSRKINHLNEAYGEI